MADDHYEPNRFLGFPVRTARPARPGQTGGTQGQPRQGEESQRVMGFPVDWFGGAASDRARPLAHLIRVCKRWLRLDEDQHEDQH
jgi:hypothetical protein